MLATGLLVATTAVPATADISGQVFGLADADLLQVEAVSLPPGCGDESLAILGQALACDFGLAQVVLGDTEARADSGATLEYDGDSGLSSYGHGSNLDVDLLTVGGSVGTLSEELLVRSDARQASGEASDADELLSLPDNPVIGLDLRPAALPKSRANRHRADCPHGCCPSWSPSQRS